MRRLSSVDAQFLAMEDGRIHAHIIQVTILEGTTAKGESLNLARIREIIEARLDLMPPLRWKVKEVPFGLDYPIFVDDEDFDLDEHLWEMGIPDPGDDVQLGDLVGRIASRPLDRSRPLWEIHVVHGLAEGRVAMITKVHHSTVDGVSGVELLTTMLDMTPEVRELEVPPRQPASRVPGDKELLVRAVAASPRQPVRLVKALPNTLRHIDQLPTMRNLPGTGLLSSAADFAANVVTRGRDGATAEKTTVKTPKVSFGGRISAHRRFAIGSLDLELLKQVKNETPGTTLNDVVVAICAGALRRRMVARGDSTKDALVAMVPISVRNDDKSQSFGNHISSLMVDIPTNEPDVRRRLERAHEVMASAKERHRAIPATLLQDSNHTVPPALLARTARTLAMTTATGWIDPPFNLTISNIPGSPAPLYCAGAKVVAQHPVNVLIEGVGVSITLLSYLDRMDFGLTADRELMPDVWALKDEMIEELEEMALELGVVKPKPKAKPRRKKKA